MDENVSNRQNNGRLSLWVIEPAASPDDPAWMDRQQFQHVIVRAESPAFARQLAATLDTPETAAAYGQQDAEQGSAFHSPRLYHVLPVDGVTSALAGPPEIIDYKVRPRALR